MSFFGSVVQRKKKKKHKSNLEVPFELLEIMGDLADIFCSLFYKLFLSVIRLPFGLNVNFSVFVSCSQRLNVTIINAKCIHYDKNT